MSTSDVPGAKAQNRDKLSRGCWAEYPSDESLTNVKDIDENDRVIFDVYDFSDPAVPTVYSHALALKEFERKAPKDQVDGSTQMLSENYCRDVGLNYVLAQQLAKMNDGGKTFGDIADELEKRVDLSTQRQVKIFSTS
jgi:hypothetical protein